MTATPLILQNALFLKLTQIIGNPKTNPPIPALIPIGKTSFLNGVKSGIYPKPVKIGARSVAWKVADIQALAERLGA